MKTRDEIQAGLKDFHGSETLTRYMGAFALTEGVKWLADSADCYWLISIIWSYQHEAVMKKFKGYQFWHLDVRGGKGKVTARADSGRPVLISQDIPYTDFPLDSIDLWVVNEDPGFKVLMLPDES